MKLLLKKSFAPVMLFFCILSLYSQKKQLLFEYRVTKNYLESTFRLFSSPKMSHWIEIDDPKVIEPNLHYIKSENYKRKQLFKDFEKNQIYSDYNILEGRFYLKDSIDLQNWTALDSTEIILGYKCQTAKTKFRGRIYYASFTVDIPISDGPWKFQGLPGMILKIHANDGREKYKMECIAIKQDNENIKALLLSYKNIGKKKRFVNWNTFKENLNAYIEKYKKMLRSSEESDEDSGYTINFTVKNYLEIFHKPLQTSGITIEF